MNDRNAYAPDEAIAPSATHIIHALTRFLWVVRRRKSVIVLSLVVVSLLGGLYYGTADRIYRAGGSLLVLKTGSEVASAAMSADRTMQDQMATYQQLCTSDTVLSETLRRLEENGLLPPEINRTKSREQWIGSFRELLSTSTRRRTSIIDLACRSRDPQACVDSINALVASYLDFIKHNHRRLSDEIADVLRSGRDDLLTRIDATRKRLIDAKQAGGDIGLQENSRVVHPAVQKVVRLNEMLLETQQRRMQLQSTLAAVRHTARTGGDFRQHLSTLEPLVGKELLLSAMGLNRQESHQKGIVERELYLNQAELRSVRPVLWPPAPGNTSTRRENPKRPNLSSDHGFQGTIATVRHSGPRTWPNAIEHC